MKDRRCRLIVLLLWALVSSPTSSVVASRKHAVPKGKRIRRRTQKKIGNDLFLARKKQLGLLENVDRQVPIEGNMQVLPEFTGDASSSSGTKSTGDTSTSVAQEGKATTTPPTEKSTKASEGEETIYGEAVVATKKSSQQPKVTPTAHSEAKVTPTDNRNGAEDEYITIEEVLTEHSETVDSESSATEASLASEANEAGAAVEELSASEGLSGSEAKESMAVYVSVSETQTEEAQVNPVEATGTVVEARKSTSITSMNENSSISASARKAKKSKGTLSESFGMANDASETSVKSKKKKGFSRRSQALNEYAEGDIEKRCNSQGVARFFIKKKKKKVKESSSSIDTNQDAQRGEATAKTAKSSKKKTLQDQAITKQGEVYDDYDQGYVDFIDYEAGRGVKGATKKSEFGLNDQGVEAKGEVGKDGKGKSASGLYDQGVEREGDVAKVGKDGKVKSPKSPKVLSDERASFEEGAKIKGKKVKSAEEFMSEYCQEEEEDFSSDETQSLDGTNSQTISEESLDDGLLPPTRQPTIEPDRVVTLPPAVNPTNRVDCGAIASGSGSTTGASKASFRVLYDVVIKEGANADTVYGDMQRELQASVAPVIAGCSLIRIPRRLQSGASNKPTNITNVVFSPAPSADDTNTPCDNTGQTAATENNGVCIPTSVPLEIYYQGSDTSGFGKRIEDALEGHEWNVDGLIGVYSQSLEDGTDGTNSNALITEPKIKPKRLSTMGFVAISMAAFALVLISILLVRRRGDDDLLKHIELKDDIDDDTFINGGAETNSGYSSSPRPRIAHIVGEEDSVISGWTGNTYEKESPNNAFDPLAKYDQVIAAETTAGGSPERISQYATGGPNTNVDVHVCSSATCDVCERRRQQGIQFMPAIDRGTAAGTPAGLPPDASREYVADDTVYL